MREFILLNKYASKVTKPNKNSKINYTGMLGWIITIIVMLSLTVPLGFIFYEIGKTLMIPLTSLGLNYDGYLFDIYLFIYPLTFGLLSVLTLVPSMVFNIYESEDLEFLFTLPIKKSSIFIFKSIMGFSMGMIPLGILVVIGIVYAQLIKANIVLSIIAILIFIIFLLFLSLLLGSFFARIMTKSSAKIISQIFLYVSIIGYVVVMSLMPKQMHASPQDMLNSFNSFFGVIRGEYSYLLPINWFLYLVNLDIRVFGIVILAIFILGYFVYKNSNHFALESGRGKTKVARGVSVSKHPVINKELRLTFRNPQNLFGIAYAMMFPIIMLLINQQFLSGAMFLALFASMYTSNLSMQLMSVERKTWPLIRLLPVDDNFILRVKVMIPTAIYTLVYLIVLIVSYFWIGINPIMFVSIIPMIAVLLFSSYFGLYIFLKNPNRDFNGPAVKLNFRESVSIQFTSFLFGLGSIIPFIMLDFINENSKMWVKIIAWFGPWIILIIAIAITTKIAKSTKIALQNWE